MISVWYTTAMKGDVNVGTMPCSRHLPNWGYLTISMLKSGNALSSQMRFTPGGIPQSQPGWSWYSIIPYSTGENLPVFEEFRAQMARAKLREMGDAMHEAIVLFKEKQVQLPYSSIRSMKLKISVPRHLLLFAAWFPSRPTICLLSGMGISVFIAIRSFLVNVVLTSVVVAVKN